MRDTNVVAFQLGHSHERDPTTRVSVEKRIVQDAGRTKRAFEEIVLFHLRHVNLTSPLVRRGGIARRDA
jgi:hypothetical protein